jgi:hypothetical protein
MGSGEKDTPLIYYVFVIILGVLALVVISILSTQHYSDHSIDGVMFQPEDSFILSETDPELTDPVRDLINQSDIYLEIEIEDTSYRWVRELHYQRYGEHDRFRMEYGNTGSMTADDLEADRVYRYSIRITCSSENETIQSLSFLDEDNYFSGSFKITEGDPDEIEFFDEDRPLYEVRGFHYVVYCGDSPKTGNGDDDTFMITLMVIESWVFS